MEQFFFFFFASPIVARKKKTEIICSLPSLSPSPIISRWHRSTSRPSRSISCSAACRNQTLRKVHWGERKGGTGFGFFSLFPLPPSIGATGATFQPQPLSKNSIKQRHQQQQQTPDAGYLALLSQLTVVADTSRQAFEERFDEMGLGGEGREERGDKSSSSSYQIFVVEETKERKVVATATLLLEKKFIRGCGLAGHVEDVVVDESVRGQKLGLR